MISLKLARELKAAGLVWQSQSLDFFVIPDRGMDERVFVISDMQANLDLFRGWPVVTFHGAAEWALDYIMTTEVVWMPTETQLRTAIQTALTDQTPPVLTLAHTTSGYCCTIGIDGIPIEFDGATASEAYGTALLYILQQ
ncbi:MAG: hypothetical protein KDE48_18175 [Anaerolineales bacterium]|nr:hypothetical protein [Anaerolineales bacterium]